MYKRILVPLDGSEIAESVLPFVSFFARVQGSDVVLIRVVEYPYEIYSTLDEFPPYDPCAEEAIKLKELNICRKAVDYLDQKALDLENQGINVISKICERPIVESVLGAAEELGADLIVIAINTHRDRKFRQLGSVADRILREGSTPVILIKPNPTNANPFSTRAQILSAPIYCA